MRGACATKRAQSALKANGRVTDAIYDAGYSGPSGFYSDAKERLGMTPSAWRDGGRGETIRWTHFDSPLGQMLIAATSKGICRLTFDDSEASLRRLFPQATIVEDAGGLSELVEGALEAIEHPAAMPDLPIDVAGTAFQEAVWRELRKIPPGETRSYAQIAAAIGQPTAVRAVGTANGDNHVAVLIPCHRVIRSDGTLGGYAGGLDKKRLLLAAEGTSAIPGTAAGRLSACRQRPPRLNSGPKGRGMIRHNFQAAAVADDRRLSAGRDGDRGRRSMSLAVALGLFARQARTADRQDRGRRDPCGHHHLDPARRLQIHHRPPRRTTEGRPAGQTGACAKPPPGSASASA